MLKGISSIVSPEILKTISEMGHGDELLLADGNYPIFGQPDNVLRLDGHGIPQILEAILKLYPLDEYVENPVTFMDVLPDDPYVPTIWEEYESIISSSEASKIGITKIHKSAFYEQGKKTFAVIKTSERALYANVILKKGVVK